MDEVPRRARRAPASHRATIKDVAEAAKVSRSTASRALTGNGYVATAVRDRVRRAAQTLGYVPDVMARNLRQQVSRSIGVLVTDLRNPFYADLASGVGKRSRQGGYVVMLAGNANSAELEIEAAEMLVALRVAGVILTPTSAEVTSYLTRHGVPVVEVDRQFAPGTVDAVVIDNEGASRQLTSELLALGHRRVAMLIDEMDWTTGRNRLLGYRRALEQAGVAFSEDLIVSGGWDAAAATKVARRLLSGRPEERPTAVFAANNVLAEGVWRAAHALGIDIPTEISLAAFDDAPWMTMVSPELTAVVQDAVALGEAAVSVLIQRLESPSSPIRTTVLSTRLEWRGSIAAPAPPR